MGSTRTKVLIVDGYNVIRKDPVYSSLIDEDDPAIIDVYARAREKLIDDVAGFAYGEFRAYIVFDAAGNVNSERTETVRGGVGVIFSPTGVEADSVIERLAREARADDRDVFVVTDDAATQWTVYSEGVTRMSVRMFSGEVNISADDWEEHSVPPSRSTLGARIDPEVAARLARFARGGNG